ncbi:phage tail tape measure protein [Mucilaginibacter lappiensis]|uniref:TP901 family phage tail tape measure protein n=1 Tax=Mucilaginibacter lappiensis TaxID=354630 RepID=A0A841J844_9SPHI|nr:phage tail tape measure protein [Mucilaginibacter lappiensis]MBB6126967.1 TP901 family phage tail tape measure protein [Mucilaginibacter lappiensis]
MGGVKVTGGQGGGLNFTANLDISQALKDAKTLNQALAALTITANGISKSSETQKTAAEGVTDAIKAQAAATKSFNTTQQASARSLTEYQQKQLELRKTMVDALAASEQLRQKNLELDASYKAGKISAQEAAAAERQSRKDRLALAEATKAARQAQVAASGSYDEASNRLKELGRSIKSAAGGFDSTNPVIKAQIEEYNKLNQSLKNFDALMGNHQRKVGGYREALKGVGSDLESLALSYLSTYAALAELTHIIQVNAEISDSMSDVRRTAGLTEKEVNALAETLKKIDTRTTLKGLLDIAVIGGQLGIAKDQLAGFTKAVDELAVSLSGELQGGAEGIAKSLGVLDNVFGITKNNAGDVEKSYNQIGSAILGLGQSGLATGDFLTDFGERVGGLAKQAKLSLPVILSYGAVLQENGVSAEVAGSSFKRLLSSLTTNRQKFFAVAQLADSNLTLKDFTKIINTDTKHALDLFFAGLEKGGTTTTSFNDILKSLRLTGPGVSQTIAALAGHQEDLNEHIEQSIKDFDNASLSAEQFQLKNDNLAGSIAKLKNEFENDATSGSISKFFKAIVDGLRQSLYGFETFFGSLNRLFTNSNAAGFLANLTGSETSLKRIDYISSNYKSSNTLADDFIKNNNPIGASNAIVTSVLADKPIKELKVMVSEYQKAAKQAATALISYRTGIANGTLEDGGNVSLADTQKNYDKLKKILGIVSDAYSQAKAKSKDATQGIVADSKEIADSELKSTEEIRKRIKELQNDALANPANKESDVSRIRALKETLKSISGNPESEASIKSALKARNDLQKNIDDLVKKGTNKQLTADEQEVESVKKKYSDMKAAAIAFNNDPVNKKKGLRVDSGGLMRAQDNELVALQDKQDTEKLKVALDSQKKLYDDYEAYKTRVGEDNAKKRYAGLIDTDKTYLQNLQAQEEAITDPEKSKGGADVDNAGNQLKLKLLQKEIAEEKLLVQKKNDDLYAEAYQAALTSSQALLAIESDYQNKVKALGKDATQEQIDNLKLQRDERIKRENEANAYAKGGYEKLMDHYDELTRGEILKRLQLIKNSYEQQYRDGKITADQLAKLMGDINSAINNIKGDNVFNRIKKAISDYRDQVKLTGKDSEGAKRKLLDLFSAISAGADGANQIVGALASSFEELGIGGQGLQDTLKNVQGMVSGLGTLAKGISTRNPIDIVTGSIGLLTSAISLFSHKDKDLQKKIDGYQKQLNALSQAYKQLDHDVASAVGESVYTDQEAQIKNLQAQQAKLTQMRDAEASKKKADQSKIDDYNNQIADIPNQIADINKSISQNLIQTTFKDLSKSLSDAFEEAFASGEDSAKKFEDVFNQVIVNAVKNSLQLKLLDPIINDFTNDLTEYAKQHDNSVIGFDFDTWKKAIQEKGELYTKGLEAIKDYLPDPNDSSSSARSEVAAALTEDTASRVYGVLAGTQVGVLQVRDVLKAGMAGASLGDIYHLAQDHFNVTVQIEVNTRRGADNTDGIAQTLKNIEKNTNGTSLRGAGLG